MNEFLRSTKFALVPVLNVKMWHEAKKQERKIHGIIVDYRKRAERRREFYEKIVSNVTRVVCLILHSHCASWLQHGCSGPIIMNYASMCTASVA